MPGAAIEVEQHERNLIAAAHELRELNQKMIAQRMSYEEFNVEAQKLDLAKEIDIVLKATQRGGNLDLVSKQGTIELQGCRREIKHLPSAQTHRFSAQVIAVIDSASGYSTVTLLNPKLTSPADSVISKYTLLTAPLVDPTMRKKLLLAQMDNLLIEIQANINAVPLIHAEGSKLEVEIQNCEGLTATATAN